VTGTTGVTGVGTLSLDGAVAAVVVLPAEDDAGSELVVTAVGASAGVILCFTTFPAWRVCALERGIAARCLTTTCVDTRRLVPTGVA
jgi:hypothetical protein